MDIDRQKTVAQIVTQNIKASHIFKKYNIDFCCGGGVSLDQICQKNEIEYDVLVNEIRNYTTNQDMQHDYDAWPLNILIEHIIEVHHKYVEENLPLLLQYAEKVVKVYGHHYHEVVEIYQLIQMAAKDLSAHMMKEEVVLFPFIKKLILAEKEHLDVEVPHFNTVINPIHLMEDEHETVGNIFKEIARLSNNYSPPEDACNTFKALYDKLDEFEQDLHTHIHLENNILHPKATSLEKRIREKGN